MNTSIAESLTYRKQQTAIDGYIHDQIVEVESAEDSMTFSIIDFFMILLVYLGPVVAFGYFVGPVVARLLRMPVPC
jgi:hypothetical protein